MSIPTRLMVMAINEFERCGRHIAAGLGLVKLRERYETFDLDDLPPDERSWRGYAAKHLRFGPERADHLLGRMVNIGGLLSCARCGATSASPCACHAPHVPTHRWARSAIAEVQSSALARATAAIEANPQKSNRALAKEIGLSEPTLRRARQKLSEGNGG